MGSSGLTGMAGLSFGLSGSAGVVGLSSGLYGSAGVVGLFSGSTGVDFKFTETYVIECFPNTQKAIGGKYQ